MRFRGKHAGDPTQASTRRPSFIPADRLWKRGIGTAAAAVLLSTALVAQGGITTDASWNDAEWVSGDVGTLNCNAPATLPLHTTGEGRMLSGSLLGIGTDTLAGVPGVTVENNEGNITYSPNALPVDGQTAAAYADPLQVTALDNLLGVNLSHLIQLPLETGLGVYGQFGQATRDRAAGASGTLTNSGGINTTGETAGKPDGLANINLIGLLGLVDQDLAQTFTQKGVSVNLDVGGIAAQSKLDACDLMWQHSPQAAVQREYLAAGADLVINSPLVGEIVSKVNSTVSGVQTAVNGLQNGGLASGLVGAIGNLVNSLIAGNILGITLGEVTISKAKVSINLTPVQDLLTGTIQDSGGILSISLSNVENETEIRVNTAKLLAKAYENDPGFPSVASDKLNGLAPNTDLLADSRVLEALNFALGDALHDWVGEVVRVLSGAVGLINVDVSANVALDVKLPLLSKIKLANISIGVSGPLDSLTSTVGLQLLASEGLLGLLLAPINALLSTLVSGLANTVTGVSGVVRNLILGTEGIVRVLPSIVTTLVGALLSVVEGLTSDLLLSKLVQVHINAQNLPQEGANDVPRDLQALGVSSPNRFDVAAIRVSVLSLLGDKEIRLYLARASAEGNVSTP